MDGEDDYDNYFDDDWTWNSDRKPGLGVFHFVFEARECAPLLKNASRFRMSEV